MTGHFSANRASRGLGLAPPLRLAWSAVVVPEKIRLPVLACAGRLFCGTDGNKSRPSGVVCASADSGELLWNHPSAAQWASFVCLATPDVVVSTSHAGGTTGRAPADGRPLWNRTDVYPVDCGLVEGRAPMIGPPRQGPYHIEMVTLSDGATVWRADCDSEPRILSASSHVVLVSGTGRPGYGILEGLAPAGGQSRWKVDLEAQLRDVGEALPDSGPRIVGAAIVVQELVYVALTGRLVACINAADGSVKWSATVPIGQPSSLACHEGRLYFNSTGCLAILDAHSAERLVWREDAMTTAHSQGWLCDDVWYVGRRGGLDAFAPDGQRIWTFPVDDFLGGPFEYEGRLIVPSVNDSRIYCFAPSGQRTGVA